MMPDFSFLRFLKSVPRRTPVRFARLRVEQLESRIQPSVNVLTYHNDNTGSGLNAAENQLSAANVQLNSFGKLFTTPVDGQVYAQPLVMSGVQITAGPNTQPDSCGLHNVVFVATENDSLYAIDTGDGQILWQRSFLDASNPDNNNLGVDGTARAIYPIPDAAVAGVTDISPVIGITGTPVIDASSNTLYVIVNTQELTATDNFYVQTLHAINLSDGTDRVAPFLIGATSAEGVLNTPIYVYCDGAGAVQEH
jgi:hypothetical protein